MEAIMIVKEIISFAISAQQEQKKAQLLKEIASELSRIHSLVENVGEVVRAIVNANEVNDQAAKIASSSSELTEGDFNSAHDYARDAAFRLMQEDVRVAGCATFLLAAGADVMALTKWSETDPNRKQLLKQHAAQYANHAAAMVPIVESYTANRVKVETFVQGSVPKLRFKVDGAVAGTRILVAANVEYYNGKATGERADLAAPLVHPLKTAAETWRAIAEERSPSYAPIFERCIVAGVEPPTPWALINGGRRIQFAVADCINNFSNIFSVVTDSVFNNIPYAASILNGAQVVHAPAKPAAFVTAEGSLAPVDNAKPISDNNSFIPPPIAGVEYDQIIQQKGIAGHMHVYPYFAN